MNPGLFTISLQDQIIVYSMEERLDRCKVVFARFLTEMCWEMVQGPAIPPPPNNTNTPMLVISVTDYAKTTLQRSPRETTVHLFPSSVSREQCREASAVICFTLMDYDVITANDFGGEAFISLR
jgi:hypothetical protein